MDIKNQTWIDKVTEIFDYTYIIIGLFSSISIYFFYEKIKSREAFIEGKSISILYFEDILDKFFSLEIIKSIAELSFYEVVLILIFLNVIGVFFSIFFDLCTTPIGFLISKLLEKIKDKKIISKFGLCRIINLFINTGNEKVLLELYNFYNSKSIVNQEYKVINYNHKFKFLIHNLRINYYSSYSFINKEIKIFEIAKNFLFWLILLFGIFNSYIIAIFDNIILNSFLFPIFILVALGIVNNFFRTQIVGSLVSIFENIENSQKDEN